MNTKLNENIINKAKRVNKNYEKGVFLQSKRRIIEIFNSPNLFNLYIFLNCRLDWTINEIKPIQKKYCGGLNYLFTKQDSC